MSLGVGVIGLGFMGRTHIRAYATARGAHPNDLVAVVDRDPGRLQGSGRRGNLEAQGDEVRIDPAVTSTHTAVSDLLADPAVDAVSICTPTETHVELAILALEHEKHVLIEKPLALASDEVERLAQAARASDRVCMPAMCMRFWPGWRWLGERVRDGSLGRVRSAVFRRLGSHPDWSPAFYGDAARTGGALFDLHVHDADLVRWLFGAPASVTSTGSLDHVTTAYAFPEGPEHVIAEGGWDHAEAFPFQMGFTVVFDQATADYVLDRDAPLMLARAGRREAVALDDGTGYEAQVRHFLLACTGDAERLEVTVDEAVGLIRMLEAERESLSTGNPVTLGG